MSDPKHAAPPAPDVPLNSARGETLGPTTPVPPQGAGPAPDARQGDAGDQAFLSRTMPSRQKAARAFLNGSAPGVQQSYAPNAETSTVEGWVEDDETVERLARWRRDAPYG